MDIRFRSISERMTFLSALMLLVTVVGCGGPKLLPVTGVVTLDGEPVAEAGVMFLPIEQGPATGGTTDAAGRFQLTTTNRLGVAPGGYHVTVTKREVTGGGMFDVGGPKSQKIKWFVPEKYSKPETSGLEAAVSPDQCEFTFALSSR